MPRSIVAALAPLALCAAVLAIPPEATQPQTAKPAPDADAAAKAASVAGGLKATVWAAEPLLNNPVAFAFDERGRCFVAETFRHTDGVIDTRGYMHMLDDDIASRSVADRLQKYQTHKLKDYSKNSESLRVVWDSTGSGRADKSDLFAAGFNRPQDGIAAGVLARKGTVYFACIPDLYAFAAKPDEPKPTDKKSLATGFGVRDQFIGHDLHGLIMGPDGKLYFSVGDRGLNVLTKEGKRLFNPDSGAVLRCDPDGANMEVVHVGLRNPQELAFDDFGNLFTYDNNSDSGDQARWVYIVEGGDSGWRCGYQYGTLMHTKDVPQGNRGPWNAEKLWHTAFPDQPAYVVPPLKHFGNGPSGIAHYPGVGLGDQYKDHFFATDFTANPGNSKIWSLAVKPKGAAFEVVDLKPFVSNMVPTDCAFGPDGAFYWLDWTGGWNKPAKGRVFRVEDPAAMKNPAVAEAKELVAGGLGKKSVEELAKLLGHPHQQVRLEAQYELAGRPEAKPTFTKVLTTAKDRLPRLHAIWGLGQTGKQPGDAFHAALRDGDAEVRLAAVRSVMLDITGTCRKLVTDDPDPRVRAAAAVAYAHQPRDLKRENATADTSELHLYAPLFDLLKANADADPYVRQAAAEGLSRMTTNPLELLDAWTAAKGTYDTPANRLGLVLALRRLGHPSVKRFLADADTKVVAEAARAIHDLELVEALPDLAKLADKPGLPDAVAFRALSANFKLGTPEHAARLAAFAARSEPDHLRAVALKLLADWAKPPRRDAITGLTQSLPERPAAVAADALNPVVVRVFAGSDAVRKEAVAAVTKLGMTAVGPVLASLTTDATQPAGTRAEALLALEALKAKELADATKAALASPEPRLRAAARVVAAKADAAAALKELPALLNDENASVIEKQMALGVMGTLRESKEIDASLDAWLDKLIDGKVPAELKLDVLESAEARATARKLTLHAPLRDKLKTYDQKVRAAAGDKIALRYTEAEAGGDAEKGKDLFVNNAAVYCQRCHKVDGQGGEVGPPMNGIGGQKPRGYLVEAIVHPNGQIAQGYQSVILNLLDGKTVSGVLRAKDKKTYTLVTAENKVLTIPVDDVEGEKPDRSAMPDDLYKKLSKRELRDLVEYLASLKEPAKGGT